MKSQNCFGLHFPNFYIREMGFPHFRDKSSLVTMDNSFDVCLYSVSKNLYFLLL